MNRIRIVFLVNVTAAILFCVYSLSYSLIRSSHCSLSTSSTYLLFTFVFGGDYALLLLSSGEAASFFRDGCSLIVLSLKAGGYRFTGFFDNRPPILGTCGVSVFTSISTSAFRGLKFSLLRDRSRGMDITLFSFAGSCSSTTVFLFFSSSAFCFCMPFSAISISF